MWVLRFLKGRFFAASLYNSLKIYRCGIRLKKVIYAVGQDEKECNV